jgi:uncharacterized protein YidB (DUF937 family)
MTMGLLDSVLGSLSQGGAGNPLLDAVLKLVNNPQTGGLEGLVRNFQAKGMGGIVDSWVSNGQNQAISPDQLTAALGSDKIGGIAQSLGMSQGDLTSKLAQMLPQVVDKLTPNGQIPDAGGLGDLLGSAKKYLG